MTLRELLLCRRFIVCVGSGGVGKTTAAAALALEGARIGRRTLVLTIDPARRLANSLGLRRLDHAERLVPREELCAAGVEPRADLYAMMLDQQRAFDELVERLVPRLEDRERVLGNRIYQQISSSLSGSHEYAAMVKLYDLHQTGRYDLLVLDTPPTTNALDFLEAPQRVADAVDSPAVQWFIRPYMTAGRLSLKLVGRGGAFVLRRLARFVGSEFLEEVARFLVEINTMLGGFRERAEQVATLLRDPGAAFVLVTSAEPVAIDEAIFFHQRLRKQSFPFAGFVVNRVHVRGGPTPELRQVGRLLSGCETLETLLPEEIDRVATAMQVTYEEFQRLADVDEREVARLVERCGRDAFYVKVPFFENDLHDIRGLLALGRHLFAVDCSACGSDLTSIDRDCCS